MTADYGSVEPVDASELTVEHDDLEHWLHGIRSELTDNPSDWLDTVGPGGDAPVPGYAPARGEAVTPAADGDPAFMRAEPVTPAADGDRAFAPTPEVRVGRHRAED